VRAVVQRVRGARVLIEGVVHGRIEQGLAVLVGIGRADHARDAELLAEKIAVLRVFDDEAGRMNRALRDVNGKVLAVPQFTLYADARHGRRPDFTAAAAPADGERLYDAFVGFLRGRDIVVESGRFGATMRLELENDGPVTIVVTTDGWREGELVR
jgi:D-tyrosyl-tRNA(Tyr) deacylase